MSNGKPRKRRKPKGSGPSDEKSPRRKWVEINIGNVKQAGGVFKVAGGNINDFTIVITIPPAAIIIAAVIIIVPALLLLLIPPPPEANNIYHLFIIDASVRMQNSFPGSDSKWSSVKKSALDTLLIALPERSNYGLIVLGGDQNGAPATCEDELQMAVPIDFDNRQDVITTVNNSNPAGEAQLTQALTIAVNQLSQLPNNEQIRKELFIFIGGGDSCDEEEWDSLFLTLEASLFTANVHTELVILADETVDEATLEELDIRIKTLGEKFPDQVGNVGLNTVYSSEKLEDIILKIIKEVHTREAEVEPIAVAAQITIVAEMTIAASETQPAPPINTPLTPTDTPVPPSDIPPTINVPVASTDVPPASDVPPTTNTLPLTDTPVPPTEAPPPSNTPLPSDNTPTATLTPTHTPTPTNTPVTPTDTPVTPTDTPVLPTDVVPPTDTPVTPSNTPTATLTPTASQTPPFCGGARVSITSPTNGLTVAPSVDVEMSVSGTIPEDCDLVLLVKDPGDQCWPWLHATSSGDNIWTLLGVILGNDNDSGKSFGLIAVITDQPFVAGQTTSCSPPGSPYSITVVRQ